MPITARLLVALLLVATLVAGLAGCGRGGLPAPSDNLTTAQAMLDLDQNLTTLREENAGMQAQIDSLRGVVAYQDSVLRQLAAAAGLPMRTPAFPLPQ